MCAAPTELALREECSIARSYERAMNIAAIVYVVGVVAGLVCGDAHLAPRVTLAVLWPLGLIAFLVTLGVLFVASLIAFPLFAGALLAASVLLWTLR